MFLKSLIKKPKSLNNKKNNDVIFLLHGYGSNELDLFSFKDFLVKINSLFPSEHL